MNDKDKIRILKEYFKRNFEPDVYFNDFHERLDNESVKNIMKDARENEELKLAIEFNLIDNNWFSKLEEELIEFNKF